MWFQPLRRRLALLVYPEIQALPEFNDRSKVSGRRTNDNIQAANFIRALDRQYSIYSGLVLTARNMPAYTGPMYEWPVFVTGITVRNEVARALTALRSDAHKTVHPKTHFSCVNYFAAIWPADANWPADLEWPKSIPRPAKHKKEAA